MPGARPKGRLPKYPVKSEARKEETAVAVTMLVKGMRSFSFNEARWRIWALSTIM